MTHFLLDLDHTLFDTERLKVDLADQITRLFDDPEAAVRFATLEHTHRGQLNYLETVIAQLCESLPNRTQASQGLEQLLFHTDYSDLIFPDVTQAIPQLKKHGAVCLFSTGDERFQRQKAASILQLFDHIMIFPDKMQHLSTIISQSGGAEVWFVDNHLKFLSPAKQTHPDIITVWMNRYGFMQAEDLPAADYQAQSLEDVVTMLRIIPSHD